MVNCTSVKVILGSILTSTAIVCSGAQVTLLNHGEGALAAQLFAIKSANSSIDYLTFEADPCSSTTQAILNAMASRAKHGVRVRLLVDGFVMNDGDEAMLNSFSLANGIEFRNFNDHTIFFNLPFRSHAKLLSVDSGTRNATYFALGRNLKDSYFGMSGALNLVGRDLMIRDGSGAQAQSAFELMWNHRWSDPSRLTAANFSRTCITDSKRDQQVEARYADRATAIVGTLPTYNCRNVDFFMDEAGFTDARYASPQSSRDSGGSAGANSDFMNDERLQHKHTTRKMLEFINGVSENGTLYMENQFYLPTYKLKAALVNARDRKHAKILILTNSVAETGTAFDATMTRQMRRAAARDSVAGMRVVPLSGLGSLRAEGRGTGAERTRWYIHAKTAVRDHRDVFVGSFNLDQLSYANNMESGVILRGCPTLAAGIEAEYNTLVKAFNSDVKSCPQCRDEMPTQGPLAAIFGIFASGFF